MMTASPELASVIVVFVVAFAAGMFVLSRLRGPVVRSGGFLVIGVAWIALSLTAMTVAHLLMGDVALAWVVAVLVWAVAAAVVRRSRRSRHTSG